jgi:hypothetical protein
MALLSATEDFRDRTLKAIDGKMARLRYIANLRDSSTLKYRHWGMERNHGEAAAVQAIGTAHREVFLDVLRTPLAELADEMTLLSRRGESIDDLRVLEKSMLPEGVPPAAKRHFSSVLLALNGLQHAKGRSNRRSASRRPRPAR